MTLLKATLTTLLNCLKLLGVMFLAVLVTMCFIAIMNTVVHSAWFNNLSNSFFTATSR